MCMLNRILIGYESNSLSFNLVAEKLQAFSALFQKHFKQIPLQGEIFWERFYFALASKQMLDKTLIMT